MRIAIVGGGFTGLAAAYRLTREGHEVSLFEKSLELGGLATSFHVPTWKWRLEKYYHHWFTNDDSALNLAKEIGHDVLTLKPSTDVYYDGQSAPFDSALSILRFPHFSLLDKVKVGATVVYLKLLSDYSQLEGTLALPWIRLYMGERATKIIWEPLFHGKFGEYKDKITLTWFWARIKKRTPRLAYPRGGFGAFTQTLVERITENGGGILTGVSVKQIRSTKTGISVKTDSGKQLKFDRVLVTAPSFVLPKLLPQLPKSYVNKLLSIEHLFAQVLILRLKKRFLHRTYWLNVTEEDSPLLAIVEHTNLVSPTHYGGEHVVYIGNYLPAGHPYLMMSARELLKVFHPQLAKINPNYRKNLIKAELFSVPSAQPIVGLEYAKKIPPMKALPNVYVANIDMVYPWDRGTNYAIEMGERVARLLIHTTKQDKA